MLVTDQPERLTRLGVFARRIREKKGWNRAIVASAGKLATIAYHMLKNKEPYRFIRTREKRRELRNKAGGTKLPPPRYRDDGEVRQNRPEGDFKVRYVPLLADVYKNEGLPPPLAFDELSSGEQRVLKEMGVAETVRAKEKVGIIARQKKQCFHRNNAESEFFRDIFNRDVLK